MAERHPPVDQRYPRERRLRKKKEFHQVFQEGRKIVRPSIVVFILPRDEEAGPSRLGLAVSRKIGKAYRRNREKRRLREIFRLNQHLFARPCDVVIVARQGILTRSYYQLQRDYLRALEKGGVRSEGNPSS